MSLWILRALLALFGLGALATAAAFALVPHEAAAGFFVASTGVAGIGTLRADLGGAFAVIGLFTLAGLRRGQARWLVVPASLIAAFLALRLMHLGLDGLSAGGIRSTVVEVFAVTLLAWGRQALLARERA